MIDRELLNRTAELAAEHLDAVAERHAGPLAGFPELRAALGGALPEQGAPAQEVVEALVRDASPGLVASPGPRYFGFVTGGALPAALAADWLASAFDQNGFAPSPHRPPRSSRRWRARGCWSCWGCPRSPASGSRPARRWRT